MVNFCSKKGPTRFDLVKSALKMFMQTKQKINPQHEFAIIALTESAIWVVISLF